MAADLTATNVADNAKAPELIVQLPLDRLFVLGDLHYNAEAVSDACFLRGYTLVTTQYGFYPHTDADVEVRRVFHKLRSVSIENFNEQFKGVFAAHEQVPTLLYRFEQQMDLRVGLKPFLKAARTFMTRPRLGRV